MALIHLVEQEGPVHEGVGVTRIQIQSSGVGPHGLVVLPKVPVGHTLVAPGPDVLWVHLQDPVEALHRLFVATDQLEDHAQIVPRVQVVRGRLHRLAEGRNLRLHVSKLGGGDREVVPMGGVVRLDRSRAGEGVHRLLVLGQAHVGDAHGGEGLGVLRVLDDQGREAL